jgi:hypothetical protein
MERHRAQRKPTCGLVTRGHHTGVALDQHAGRINGLGSYWVTRRKSAGYR